MQNKKNLKRKNTVLSSSSSSVPFNATKNNKHANNYKPTSLIKEHHKKYKVNNNTTTNKVNNNTPTNKVNNNTPTKKVNSASNNIPRYIPPSPHSEEEELINNPDLLSDDQLSDNEEINNDSNQDFNNIACKEENDKQERNEQDTEERETEEQDGVEQDNEEQDNEEQDNEEHDNEESDDTNPLDEATFEFTCDVIEPTLKELTMVNGLKFPESGTDEEKAKILLSWLVAPVDPDTFINEIWEKKCLHIKRYKVAPNYYKGLFASEFLLNDIIKKNEKSEDDALIYGKDLDITTYKNGKRETKNPEGKATTDQVKKFFDKGCSIRLLRPQKYSTVLWKLLSGLEDYFENMVGVNSYWTPATTQGFAPHFDDVEAFVLQTEGSKNWKLYETDEPNVLASESSENFSQEELLPCFYESIVNKGDMLYFPRGVVHQAIATNEASLHITISTAHHNSYGDYMTELLKYASQMTTHSNLFMRKSVPRNLSSLLGFLQTDSEDPSRDSFKDLMFEMLGKIAENLPFDIAADVMVRKFLRDRLPPFLENPPKSGKVTENAMIRAFKPNHMRLICENGNAVIYTSMKNTRGYREVEEQSIEFGADFGPALEHLFANYPNFIKIKDLPELEVEDAMELVEVLIDNQFVEFK